MTNGDGDYWVNLTAHATSGETQCGSITREALAGALLLMKYQGCKMPVRREPIMIRSWEWPDVLTALAEQPSTPEDTDHGTDAPGRPDAE